MAKKKKNFYFGKDKVKILGIILVGLALIILIVIFVSKLSQLPEQIQKGPAVTLESAKQQIKNNVNFYGLENIYNFESISASPVYQQSKAILKEICFNNNLGQYLDCLRSGDEDITNKIMTQLKGLSDPTPVLEDIYELDSRFGTALNMVKAKFEDSTVTNMASQIDSEVNLDKIIEGVNDVSGVYSNDIYNNKEFQKYLKNVHDKRLEVCNSPSLAVRQDCEDFTLAYSHSEVFDLFYGKKLETAPQEAIAFLGETTNRALLGCSNEEILEAYNQKVKPFASTELAEYISKMKAKYPELNSKVTNYSKIQEFLMDPMDSIFYQTGKYYYYLAKADQSDCDPRDPSVANEFLKSTAESLGMTVEGLNSWIKSEFGSDQALAEGILSQVENIKQNQAINYEFLHPDYVNFSLYELYLNNDYWQNMENYLIEKNIFYNNLRDLRLKTYILFYTDDLYKESSNRDKLFESLNTDISSTAIQNLFKYSRYIERDDLNKFLEFINK